MTDPMFVGMPLTAEQVAITQQCIAWKNGIIAATPGHPLHSQLMVADDLYYVQVGNAENAILYGAEHWLNLYAKFKEVLDTHVL